MASKSFKYVLKIRRVIWNILHKTCNRLSLIILRKKSNKSFESFLYESFRLFLILFYALGDLDGSDTSPLYYQWAKDGALSALCSNMSIGPVDISKVNSLSAIFWSLFDLKHLLNYYCIRKKCVSSLQSPKNSSIVNDPSEKFLQVILTNKISAAVAR